MKNQKKTLKVILVSQEVRDAWLLRYERSDINKIAAATGYARQTIGRALRFGMANTDVITKINHYYGIIKSF